MVDQHVGAETSTQKPAVLGTNGVVPVSAAPVNEGRTVAAWTLVGIVILGAVLIALAVALSQGWLVWVGVVIIVGGLVVGGVLRALGYGQVTSGGRSVAH